MQKAHTSLAAQEYAFDEVHAVEVMSQAGTSIGKLLKFQRAGYAVLTFLRATPISHALTFEANRSEHKDSAAYSVAGLMLTNINVLASPPKDGCSNHVSLEFL